MSGLKQPPRYASIRCYFETINLGFAQPRLLKFLFQKQKYEYNLKHDKSQQKKEKKSNNSHIYNV